MLGKCGVTSSARYIQETMTSLQKNHDEDVVNWKLQIEDYHARKSVFDKMKLLGSTVDLCSLTDVRQAMESHITEIEAKQLPTVVDMVQHEVQVSCFSTEDALHKLHASLVEPPGFQIIGDNLDLYVHAKQLGTEHKNRNHHFFQLCAVLDEVHGKELPDGASTAVLKDIEPAAFLPSQMDTAYLRRELVVLWSRTLVKWMPGLKVLEKSVVWHIPHEHSDIMKQKSHVVRLPTILINFHCSFVCK